MRATLDIFTAIRVHGLLCDANGVPIPLTLNRTVSFPSPTWTGGKIQGEPFHPSLASREIPTTGYQLEARMSTLARNYQGRSVAGRLGHGRSAIVFSLDIIDVTGPNAASQTTAVPEQLGPDNESAMSIKTSLPRLSLKVAKPAYARSLAREAWFYERLDLAGMLNVVTPRHYGLFHCANLSQIHGNLRLNIPGYDSLVEHHFSDHPEGKTFLPEETGSFTCVDDEFSSHKSSPWYTERETKGKPCATVLLMEELGEVMTDSDFENDEQELEDIYDDLCDAKVLHGDMRFPNLLKASPDAAECPTHHRPHRWFWVDWEDALIVHHQRALHTIKNCKGNLATWASGGGDF
ncbi:hypothetical protein BKA70DRAFT_1435527 [Coprinopsis sp. MPI-PUGE-AT-0042]|nr:hypothetical protein BKA70DRAFT_1435527 [Coprinopsis sp. MPI-PUGE-AT-0042]